MKADILGNLAIVSLFFSLGYSGVILEQKKNSSVEQDNSQNEQSSIDIGSSEILAYAITGPTGVIKLNVTFINNFNTSYHVFVKQKITKECNEETFMVCKEHHIPKDTPSIIIPTSDEIVEDECELKFTCTYEILVQSDQRDLDLTLSKTYKIPECVDNYCMCIDKDQLPKPSLNEYNFSRDGIRIKYKTDLSHFPSFLHFLSRNVEINFMDITIFNMISCKEVNFPPIFSTRNAFLTDDTLEIPFDNSHDDYKCLKLVMNVVASIGHSACKGHRTNKTLHMNKTMSVNELVNDEKLEKIETSSGISTTFLFGIAILALLSFAISINAIIVMKGRHNRGFVRDFPEYRINRHTDIPMIDNLLYTNNQPSNFVCHPPKPESSDKYEILRSELDIGREIGRGAFGMVYVASMNIHNEPHRKQKLAVKKLKKNPSPDEEEEFLSEIETMMKVGKHPNVVRLVGYCKKEYPIMMIMEYVPCGDLLKYLRNLRPKLWKLQSSNCLNANLTSESAQQRSNNSSKSFNNSKPFHIKYLDLQHSSTTTSSSENSCITSPDYIVPNERKNSSISHAQNSSDSSIEYELSSDELHNFARQIASGMKHLESLNVTHRDLAARNILIDEQKTLKISDFGLSRDGIYLTTRSRKVPLRWLSIEAMKDNLYSSKSDVWAFAVLLWEIGTLGAHPYPTVENHEILKYLTTGNRLEKPEICSDFLYDLMLHCWIENPDERPDFEEIYDKLNPTKNIVYIDFTVLNPCYVFPPINEPESKNTLAER